MTTKMHENSILIISLNVSHKKIRSATSKFIQKRYGDKCMKRTKKQNSILQLVHQNRKWKQRKPAVSRNLFEQWQAE